MNYISLFAFFSFNIFATQITVEKLPVLTTSLIKEIASANQLSDREIDEYNLIFSQYGNEFSFLDNLLLKSVLVKSYDLKKSYKMIDQKLYDRSKEKIATIAKSQVFTKLIYTSFLNDLAELLTDPEYRNFVLLNRQNQRVNSNGLRAFENKIKMLTPWLRLLIESEPEEFTKSINEINLSLLNRVKNASSFLSRTSETKELSKFKYIQKIDRKLEEAKKEIAELSFEVSPSPTPDYVPPSVLPTAVDDWVPVDDSIIENGLPLTKDMLFPDPDPDYSPPKVLPKPVDKWGDQ